VRWAGCLVAAVIGAGCVGGDEVTEVRMLVETDIDVQEPILMVSPSDRGDTLPSHPAAQFPFLVAITPDAQLHPFDLNVQMRPGDGSQVVIVVRNVRDVAFVATERRMFVMPLHAKCACQGTSCPGPGDPDCDDLRAPALLPLDERVMRWPDLPIDLSEGPH
jgi:hypothetical protein